MLDSRESSPPPLDTLDVLIVGGGLCGLATAISVTIAGHNAIVFEAFDRPHPVGGGLQSSPNGTRLLSRWGLDDILKPVATAPRLMKVHGLGGRLLAEQEQFDKEVSRRYGFPLWTFHRIDLQSSLRRRANELGISVHYSSRVTEVDIYKPSIELENGDRHYGDLVVVSDGKWSSLRSSVLGRTFHPQPTGDIAYRVTIDRASIQDDELLELLNLPQIRLWVGQDLYAIGYSVRGCEQFSLLLLLPGNLIQEDSSMAAVIKEIKKRDPMLAVVLNSAQRVNKWREVHLPSLPTDPLLRGSCVFAGDICRSMHPVLAQSLNLGLEDAATLGCVLSHVTSPKQLARAAALYNRLTTGRTNRLLEETGVYEQKLRFSTIDTVHTELFRDNGTLPSSCRDNDWIFPKNYSWIWEYDAYEQAEEAYLSEPY